MVPRPVNTQRVTKKQISAVLKTAPPVCKKLHKHRYDALVFVGPNSPFGRSEFIVVRITTAKTNAELLGNLDFLASRIEAGNLVGAVSTYGGEANDLLARIVDPALLPVSLRYEQQSMLALVVTTLVSTAINSPFNPISYNASLLEG